MKASENSGALTSQGKHVRYGSAETSSGRHTVRERTARTKAEYKSPQPIPFNGLLTNKLLTELPGADFARLLPHLEPVSLVTGDDLYKFGDGIDYVYFPETAVISHIYFMEDGSTTEAAIVGHEGMLGLSAILDSRQPSFWVKITVGGSALRAETEVIKREFARGGALQQALLSYTGARLAQLSQKAICNGRHKLDERLCTWLLMIQDRTSERKLPLTHEEVAHHLGTRRAGITTYCNTLRQRGIIDYHRGLISILDRQRLEEAACECYRTLRQMA